MFVLVTGAPGSSKTSHVIDKFMDVKDRPIFYRGIRDLVIESWTELTDSETLSWPDHLPDGAILIVDEAQQLWPVRPSSKPVPAGLTALETHRHRGWDIWFITQEPSLVDSHARKICNEQYHYVRPFGAPYAVEYHSGSGFVSPSSQSDLARCNKTRKKLPKRVWGLYKSAEVHTHKFRLPKIVLLLPVFLLVGGVAWYFYLKSLGGEGATVNQVESDSAVLGQIEQRQQEKPADWSTVFKSEIPGLPFTAPLYRDQAMTARAIPVVHGCMSMRADFSDCRCYTQQGTRIADMPVQMCRTVLRDGLFNHLASEETGERRRESDADAGGTPRGAGSPFSRSRMPR